MKAKDFGQGKDDILGDLVPCTLNKRDYEASINCREQGQPTLKEIRANKVWLLGSDRFREEI